MNTLMGLFSPQTLEVFCAFFDQPQSREALYRGQELQDRGGIAATGYQYF
ncbi:hypothetical protein ACFTAO_30510 [Paenibacillus rhizoplanae]